MVHVIAELLDELARTIPNLHGAACRGHPELFDADRHDHQAITAAKAVCASCPVLGPCRAWLADQPVTLRPCGVVAGRYLGAPPPLPRSGGSLRVCAECGRCFVAKRRDATLCSAACRMAAHRSRRSDRRRATFGAAVV